MQVDPYGLMLVCVLCGALGYFIGWMGGVVEGREQERKRTRGVVVAPHETEQRSDADGGRK